MNVHAPALAKTDRFDEQTSVFAGEVLAYQAIEERAAHFDLRGALDELGERGDQFAQRLWFSSELDCLDSQEVFFILRPVTLGAVFSGWATKH